MRSTFTTLGLGLAAALVASTALAGPIGSGLFLTEQLARGSAPAGKPMVRIAADPTCLRGVIDAVEENPGVHQARVARDHLRVSFHTDADARAETASVTAVVTKACGAARVAGA